MILTAFQKDCPDSRLENRFKGSEQGKEHQETPAMIQARYEGGLTSWVEYKGNAKNASKDFNQGKLIGLVANDLLMRGTERCEKEHWHLGGKQCRVNKRAWCKRRRAFRPGQCERAWEAFREQRPPY